MPTYALTERQRRFVDEYVKTNNAHKSALVAGYSKNFAQKNSGTLLRNDKIASEIQRLRNRLNERADKSATDVVNEYAKIAFVDRVDFLKPDPHCPGEYIYKAPHELTREQRSIVEKVTMRNCDVRVVDTTTGEVTELVRQEYSYVFSDKQTALNQMGRHFGIFDDKLKLVKHHQNPFKDATPEQLEKLRSSFVGIMAGETVDGEYEEVQNVLPDGQGRTGTRG